jgi:hypothetical protein
MKHDMEKNKAIVLKSFLPYKQKLCVLDRELGKIMVVPMRQNMSYASLIFYHIREQGNQNSIFFIHDIEVIDMPLLMAQNEILFIHHVLELCYFFMPLNSPAPCIFDLMQSFYTSEKLMQSSILKKVFLFQFFMNIGLFPEDRRFDHPYFHYLATASIDIIDEHIIHLVIEQALDDWLMRCIKMHPSISNFKTVHFLQNSRIV